MSVMKKDKKNTEKRSFSKRFELNELEAKTLRMKSDQCGLSEADYIRELIMKMVSTYHPENVGSKDEQYKALAEKSK